ncbi:hypothetical protein EGR_06033 [Echinococcus granulosus]|uniref:Uncharacterized protein n=1 Tax=Echinococcus granulosus TaxID=6210 RepID=W6UDX2_ECHGR|nr:hypothetical protein EGR_06033 [Echinococcus granulosus]EUB59041.1 hypothetical protein EGR_06033 [Echinococcus granulosus]
MSAIARGTHESLAAIICSVASVGSRNTTVTAFASTTMAGPDFQDRWFSDESLRSLIFAPDSGEVVTAFESFQSSVCSPVDERLQRQCFSELPADQYEVLEGSPVRMRCRVSWQSGKAQWRAHNTLLVRSCDPYESAF